MPDLVARRATTDDIDTVVDLWNEAQRWLGDKGLDQWQYPVKMDNVRRAIDQGSCWLFAASDGTDIATVTLDENADPALWLPDDRPDRALYIHRLVVTRSASGQGLGERILSWAESQARQRGKHYLRLDAWTNNPGLHDYYLRHGFRPVRVAHDAPSGALFERLIAE